MLEGLDGMYWVTEEGKQAGQVLAQWSYNQSWRSWWQEEAAMRIMMYVVQATGFSVSMFQPH